MANLQSLVPPNLFYIQPYRISHINGSVDGAAQLWESKLFEPICGYYCGYTPKTAVESDLLFKFDDCVPVKGRSRIMDDSEVFIGQV